jgi:hypothetical protein
MKCARLLLILPFLLTGCTTTKLRTSTVSQAGSLAELQYQQVLNNLAMFCSNPDIMPSLVNLKDGSAQIADVGSASYLGDWHRAFGSHPTVLGSRTVVEQWSVSPVTDDNELELLQLAYKRAVGIDRSLQDHIDLANDIAHELVKQLPEVDDYRGSMAYQYEDFKNTYRNRGTEPSDRRDGGTSTQNTKRTGDNKTLPISVLDIKNILKYMYIDSGQDQSLPRLFEQTTISSVDSKMIYPNELIRYLNIYAVYPHIATFHADRDGMRWPFFASKLEYDSDDGNKPTEPKWECNKAPAHALMAKWSRLDKSAGARVDYVTPEAAAARRQVKDLENDLLSIPTDCGWYGRGGKHDVPRDACFVGHYRDCYVWVGPDGLKNLSNLTIKTLKFSTLIKDESVLTVPGPRFTPASGFPSP